MERIAYTKLYNEYADELYSYGMSLGFSTETCVDSIHDVFCALYENRKKLSHVKNMKFYLFRMMKNNLLDIYYETKGITFTNIIPELPFSVNISILDNIIGHETEKIIKNKVDTLMSLLTDRQREAVYLRYMQEMEYDEIGQLLKMTAESARKTVHRGIKKMRASINLDKDSLIILLIFYHNNLLLL